MKSKSKGKPHSDSEGSVDSNSLSLESGNVKTVKDNRSKGRRGSEWEILEGLKDGQRYNIKPQVLTGYLHKKRKWPLKGWHKRYFVINKGILVYARTPSDITRGKIHGSVDIGLSVISTKSKSRRIDIDAEEFIYHLKAKRLDTFVKWVEQLRKHRLFRQHLLTFGARENTCTDCDNTISFQPNPNSFTPPISPARDKTLHCGLIPAATPVGGRLAVWLVDSMPMLEGLQKDLKLIGQNIVHLSKIADQISSSLAASVTDQENTSEGCSPNVKKDRRKFGLLKKKSNKGSSVDLASSSLNDNLLPSANVPISSQSAALSSSQTCLSSNASSMNSLNRPQSLPGSEHLMQQFVSSLDNKSAITPELQMREDFIVLAKDVQTNLKTVLCRLTGECDRLKTACESENSQLLNMNNSNVLVSLRHSLNQALVQNNELKNRLNRVHEIADLADISSVGPASDAKQIAGNLSYSSSCLSASEFFDAEDNLPKFEELEDKKENVDNSESSSENNSFSSEEGEEENSLSSENSDVAEDYTMSRISGPTISVTGRRTKLPAPRPNLEGLSLWNILCKNIGKDLSQVSMPVSLNEPLNMLQRLCEELEYSELLDKASELDDPYERMIYVAAFAVSSYCSSYYRAGSKPFNPFLGETYECVREDKGFKFISEQVSHHPPISVCHAESKNFIFWQDVRIKTKFWGKSMEFQPAGTANVLLPKSGEQYEWNKVTTCVHNLFSGQRWVDQYGELKISSSSGITCKLTFVKASYWSSKRHEVHGSITSQDGKVVRNIFGKWSEGLYCGVAPSAKCIWRPGTMPEDYELYYGFTRFAIELNDLDSETAKYLPPTDTRFRPDQRLLEEGDLQGAENLKLTLEQSQRERRKKKEAEGKPAYESKWFFREEIGNGEEKWTFGNKYWEMKKNPGFANMEFEALW
ncbi:oxysterol-binding protein 3, putative [Pediculus humanus corporis]|uniref:Oxysterol-binding protein 3, putative n=1 Tax=Pediculus humanus subsp. corporis TaxID=121224 RepID=E0W0F1_PEDHC|nr:oxysterol-binding protein 3, putative [Pediculus humanus corporis]EEB19107.1 oxysterol-binding protein 3, putative [Pediculus humanus corporis]